MSETESVSTLQWVREKENMATRDKNLSENRNELIQAIFSIAFMYSFSLI